MNDDTIEPADKFPFGDAYRHMFYWHPAERVWKMRGTYCDPPLDPDTSWHFDTVFDE